jgi:hypothetical protein
MTVSQRLAIIAAIVCLAGSTQGQPTPSVTVDQGAQWDATKRDRFYSVDQGSRIIPLNWINALKHSDGNPFMADRLQRYGFLPNNASPAGLPVGFTAADDSGATWIGMTCAACHTRQIEYGGKAYRIDGGPGLVDFQSFVNDLDTAVDTVIKDAAALSSFATAVLGSQHTPADEIALRQQLSGWHHTYHALMAKALPHDKPWGLGRLDAVGMIFNRLTGLDLGPAPTHVIEENIHRADAPMRYPFLWNAARQDKTQWSGFVENTSEFQRVARNLGQLFGVFGRFYPKKTDGVINFWADNSTQMPGLLQAEALMHQIGPPRWPWSLNAALVNEGRKVFEGPGRCAECHGERLTATGHWQTPLLSVGTDSRHFELFSRQVRTGVLEGARPPTGEPLAANDTAHRTVQAAVRGTLEQAFAAQSRRAANQPTDATADSLYQMAARAGLRNAVRSAEGGYEARVLRGVWAAAPYLHNGSVPTLADLLKPAAQRPASFKVGRAYDPIAIGLAVDQPSDSTTLVTTDCSDPRSGNSRCGHEFGTNLTETEKAALLEYLKQL